MKKFLLVIFFSISTIALNPAKALNPENFTPVIDRKIEKLTTIEQKVAFLQNLSSILSNNKYSKDKNSDFYDDIRTYSLQLLQSFQNLLDEESLIQISIQSKKLNLPTLSDNISNIDEQMVRDAILSWHNEEREIMWSNPYSYNLDLEWSANIWADNLAKSGKTKNLHPRNSWDGYYNYSSMFNRFSDLWIEFPYSANWAATFSESIGYNSYKCSKSDCTDDLINAVKKTWTWLIMKEKSYRWSHYNAATMKHFSQMWAGIAIDYSHNRYYVVFHYGVDF